MSWIDNYLIALKQGFSGTDIVVYEPINFFDICYLYADGAAERIMNIIDNAKNKNIRELAEKMYSPSQIRAEMFISLIYAKLSSYNLQDRMKIANFFNSMLLSICLEDPYAKNWKNIIHSKDQIESFSSHLKEANPEIAKVLGKLSNACYNLSYGLYSDINPQICYETFGPYKISEKKIMVVKQFSNLKPEKLWQRKTKNISCDRIHIICVYENVIFKMDGTTHSIYEGDLINGLKQYYLEIDGKIVYDLNKIKELIENIATNAVNLWNYLISLDFESAKVMYLKQRAYNYKQISGFLGIDWKPTNKEIEAVKGKKIDKNFWPKFKNKEEETEFWLNLVDPREELKK